MQPTNLDRAPSQAVVHRKRLESEHLPKALDRIVAAMQSKNEKIAFDAARWIAEMVLGRPKQPVDGDTAASEVALMLAATLREVLEESRTPAPPAPTIIEGGVRVLGAVRQDEVIEVYTTKRGVVDDDEDFPE